MKMNTMAENEHDLTQYRGADGRGWKCDRCGENIKTAGDGWLQWISIPRESSGDKMRDLTLVHHLPASPRKNRHEYGCQFDSQAEFRKDGGTDLGFSLNECCGSDGLTRLLSLLEEEDSSRADVLEIIKRVHTPGYEQARQNVGEAIAEGIIEPNLPQGFYLQSDIREVLRWAEHEKEAE